MKIITVSHDTNPTSYLNYLPLDYGQKRDYPKIDLYVDGVYYGSTNWARTLETAIHALLSKAVMTAKTRIMAEYAKEGK